MCRDMLLVFERVDFSPGVQYLAHEMKITITNIYTGFLDRRQYNFDKKDSRPVHAIHTYSQKRFCGALLV